MNKGLIGFVIGAAIGSAITYFATKDRLQQEADDEVVEMRKYVRERLSKGSESPSEHFKEVQSPVGKPKFRRAQGGSESSVEAQNEMKEKILKEHYNYSELSKSDSDISEEEGGATPMTKKTMIYAIDQNEFNLGNEEYDKASLTWYPGQHILTDEDDHRISTECIGGDEMLEDGFEDGVKYVRNDALNSDYEIVVDDVNTWSDSEA